MIGCCWYCLISYMLISSLRHNIFRILLFGIEVIFLFQRISPCCFVSLGLVSACKYCLQYLHHQNIMESFEDVGEASRSCWTGSWSVDCIMGFNSDDRTKVAKIEGNYRRYESFRSIWRLLCAWQSIHIMEVLIGSLIPGNTVWRLHKLPSGGIPYVPDLVPNQSIEITLVRFGHT